MKAYEYVQTYGDKIYKEARENKADTLQMIFQEFGKEILDIAKARNVKTKEGLTQIIKEQNNKWNAFARKFQKKYKADFIRTNAIQNTYMDEVNRI